MRDCIQINAGSSQQPGRGRPLRRLVSGLVDPVVRPRALGLQGPDAEELGGKAGGGAMQENQGFSGLGSNLRILEKKRHTY